MTSSVSAGGRIAIRQGSAAILLFAFALSDAAMPAAAAANEHGIATYVLENQSSGMEKDVPVTFGAVFANGDVPAGASVVAVDGNGTAIPLQVDVKARNRDGSLRHAIVTLDIAHLPHGTDYPVVLERGLARGATPIGLSALPKDFDARVDLNAAGSHLTASIRELLAHSVPKLWLSGPLVTEWWVAGPLRDSNGQPDPLMHVEFGIRSYGKGRPLRVEVDVENDWTWVAHPRTEFYDASIQVGGKTVFVKPSMEQPAQSRWRKVFWVDGSVAPDVLIKPPLKYLEHVGVVPNYDPNIDPNDPSFAGLVRRYLKEDRSPMSHGIIEAGMPNTGQRGDIGPLPAWTVDFLVSGTKTAADMMYSAADLSGGFPVHYRNIKTGYPMTTEESPKISTNYNFVGRSGHYLQRPITGGRRGPLFPDASHEPSLDFVPYLLTGERYYLQELIFWSQWNSWGTAPGTHGFEKSLFGWDQLRGQAWSLRTLAQAAYITPDSNPAKQTLLRELKANADWYNKHYTDNPDANIFHLTYVGGRFMWMPPWMDDFMMWSVQYAVNLGFDEWKPFARWKARFSVQRMINPHFCWILATPYQMHFENPDHTFFGSWAELYRANFYKRGKAKILFDPDKFACGSQDMANALGLKRAGEMMGRAGAREGFPAQMQPALAAAVDAGEPGAKEAWAKFQARPVQPRNGVDPRWAIVPRSNQ